MKKILKNGALHLRHTIGQDSVPWPITPTISGSAHSTYEKDQWTSDIDPVLFQCWAGVSQVPFSTNFLIGCGQPRDNSLHVCTFKQQSQKAVSAHFTSEQMLPLQADNVLQPVVWGGWAVGVYTLCLLSPGHDSLYPLWLCYRLHCDIKITDCGINLLYFQISKD